MEHMEHQPLIVNGAINGVPVTIFGEIHNMIDQSFYDSLSLSKKALWVEHSSVFCELKEDEEPMFLNAKGSEWVWFTSKKNNKKIECIDIRVEYGFMSRIEEMMLKELLDNMTTSDRVFCIGIEKIVYVCRRTLKALLELAENKIITPIPPYIVRHIQELKATMKTMLTVENSVETVYGAAEKSYKNLLKISSLVIDAYIIKKLEEYKNKSPIYIFVGLNHALRLAHLLSFNIESHGTIDIEQFAKAALENL